MTGAHFLSMVASSTRMSHCYATGGHTDLFLTIEMAVKTKAEKSLASVNLDLKIITGHHSVLLLSPSVGFWLLRYVLQEMRGVCMSTA